MPDGFDVVWVQKQQIVPMLAHPTDPYSMSVEVETDYYAWDDVWKIFEKQTSEDLTARLPGVGYVRFVLISIDGATSNLIYTNGDEYSVLLPPLQIDAIPIPPTGAIPVVAVYLLNTTTSIGWDDLYDMRLLISGGGYMSVGAAPRDGAYVVASTHADLTADRTLVVGADISLTDGGAKGNITVARRGNRILRFDSGGNVLMEYAWTEAGLIAALAAGADGDTVWLPVGSLLVTSAVTIPNGVTLMGMHQPGVAGGAGLIPGAKIRCTSLVGDLVTLSDNAVIDSVQVELETITIPSSASAICGSGASCALRRCHTRSTAPGTPRGFELSGSGAVAECVTVAAGTTGAYVSDGELINCRCSGSINGLLTFGSGTVTVRGGRYSGGTVDMNVAAGTVLEVYAVKYATSTIDGTLTHLAGDRAGTRRDETIIGDWNINAGEFGLPAGVAFPGAPDQGDIYYRSDEAKTYIYNGDLWLLLALGSGAGAGSPVVQVSGALVTTTGVGGVYVVTANCAIAAVYIYCKENGSAGSTIVDVNKNGVSIFNVTPANRPELAHDDIDNVAKSGVPDVGTAVEGDVLSVDIDQIATGVENLTVVIATSSDAGTVEVQQDDVKILDASIINFEGDGITVTDEGAGKGTIDIAVEIQEDDVKVIDAAVINFEGGGSKVTDEGGGKVTVDIEGGGAWALIEEVILTGSEASVTFSTIPGTYRSLVLQCQARTDRAAEGDEIGLIINTDAGNNYDRIQTTTVHGAATGSAGRAEAVMFLGPPEAANSRASSFSVITAKFVGYALTDREKYVIAHGGRMGDVSADTDLYIIGRYLRWRSTAAITTLALSPTVGPNFVSGSRFTLYGVL